jgi:catechol 2,3-dioxygenase-like lactoylglutathione lyase family enzyme
VLLQREQRCDDLLARDQRLALHLARVARRAQDALPDTTVSIARVRIVEARFPASDPDALTSWYGETLGAGPTFVAGEPTPHHFAFHVADLDAWRDRLDVSEEYDFSSWGGARSVYFRDPEGNVGELIARPRAHAELSLAEVGLPVEDVAAAVESLRRELGVPAYRDSTEDFAPLGDEEGLFIVVRIGRGWFPAGVPAGAAAIDATIAGAREGTLTVPGSGHRVVGVG